jgi:DNA-binding SARP family transcriptional activator
VGVVLSQVGRLLVNGRYAEAGERIQALERSGVPAAGDTEILAAAMEMCVSCADVRAESESYLSAAAKAQSLENRHRNRALALLRLAAGPEREPAGRGDTGSREPRRAPRRTAARAAADAPTLTLAVASERPDPPAPARMAVHCLGPLQVYRGEERLGRWCSRRSKSLFKYLVAHRGRPVSKDVLMDAFWPEAAPEAARNSLHVAIHGLRRSLRARDEQASPVLFRDNAYMLDPDLDVWVDVEEFERLVAAGRRAGAAGDVDAAIRDYQAAQALYQGDLFDDDPYEDWMLPRRRWLRDAHLGLLQELSAYQLARGDYASCATLARQVIAAEPYREDAHRDLIRCYARQEQWYLALRQYRDCAQALRIAFNGSPAPQTTELHERVLRREPV